MSINTASGRLTLIDMNTDAPKVFFDGVQVQGVVGVKVDWESDEHRVKLKVLASPSQHLLVGSMRVAGITVKEV